MEGLKVCLFILFFPASFGLLWQSFTSNSLSEQLISFSFFLFSLEQARMAFIDLKSYSVAKSENLYNYHKLTKKSPSINLLSQNTILASENHNLSQFLLVTVSTIIIELSGFYLALFSIGWGAISVLISLIWFNIFSPLKVIDSDKFSLTNYLFYDKIMILLADFICLMLMSLWIINVYPLVIALIILLITLIFAVIKYHTCI